MPDDRIEINPEVMCGKPVIRGTRITVEIIIEKISSGIPLAAILQDYPALDGDDLIAAMIYNLQTAKSSK